MLILNQKEIQKIIPLSEIKQVVDIVEQAFHDYGEQGIQMPPKNYLYFSEYDGDLRIMPGFSPKLKMAGTKMVNVHPKNPEKGLATVMAAIILNDARTGVPLALLDGTYITGMRTGAAGAVATKYLARENAQTLGVVGAGGQAIFQIAAINEVRNIKEVSIFDINDDAVEKLKEKLTLLGITSKKARMEEAAQKDILVTITPCREPIIKEKWILPGTHINCVGADAVGKQELDPEILKHGKIIIDEWIQASHSGEINVPLKKGQIKIEDICCTIGEIAAGMKKGRESDHEITIFDSTGLAIQDMVCAKLIYEKAKKGKFSAYDFLS